MSPGSSVFVLGIGEEGEVARAGILDAGDAGDLDVAVAFEAAPEALGEFAELHDAILRHPVSMLPTSTVR